jgi:hypothetical protein
MRAGSCFVGYLCTAMHAAHVQRAASLMALDSAAMHSVQLLAAIARAFRDALDALALRQAFGN